MRELSGAARSLAFAVLAKGELDVQVLLETVAKALARDVTGIMNSILQDRPLPLVDFDLPFSRHVWIPPYPVAVLKIHRAALGQRHISPSSFSFQPTE